MVQTRKCDTNANADANRKVLNMQAGQGLCYLTTDFFVHRYVHQRNRELALVAQLDVPSDWRPGGRGFNPRRGRQHSFMEIDHEIFSTVILSLPLNQEGQLSVSGERMGTILVHRLED